MPIRDNLGLINRPKGQGFSKERMDLFQRVIEDIQEAYEQTEAPVTIVLPYLPANADLDRTIEKAIEFYAIPNGICIVEDPEEEGYIWIRTPEEYGEFQKTLSSVMESMEEQKQLATAAWMNGRFIDK